MLGSKSVTPKKGRLAQQLSLNPVTTALSLCRRKERCTPAGNAERNLFESVHCRRTVLCDELTVICSNTSAKIAVIIDNPLFSCSTRCSTQQVWHSGDIDLYVCVVCACVYCQYVDDVPHPNKHTTVRNRPWCV